MLLQALQVEVMGDGQPEPIAHAVFSAPTDEALLVEEKAATASFQRETQADPLRVSLDRLRQQGIAGPRRADLGQVHTRIQDHDRNTWGADPLVARRTMMALAAALYFRGRSSHTWDAQSSALRTFDYFCHNYFFETAPVTEITLVYYTVWSSTRVSVGTIKKYVGHIRKRCEEEDIQMPKNDQMPRLSQIWEGLKRLQAAVKGTFIRLPMTFSLCKKVYGLKQQAFDKNPKRESISLYSMDHPLMASVVGAVMLCGAMRPGEATVRKTGAGVITRPLLIKHIIQHEEFTTLKVPFRKTHQDGEQCEIVLGPTHEWFCAHSLLIQWLEARRATGEVITPDSYLFPTKDRTGKLAPLTYDLLTKHLTMDLEAAGFPSTHYKGHSFRIGAATTMALNGVPDYWIEDLGNWARGSTAMRRYIHLSAAPEEERARITCYLGRQFGSDPHTGMPGKKARPNFSSHSALTAKSGLSR